MQTFLILGEDKKFIDYEINKIKNSFKIHPINICEIFPAGSYSISIDEIRKIIKILNLKPLVPGFRMVVIYEAENATTEAGNALLKILEEPPDETFIILTTTNLSKILPTIVSRCQIVSNNKIIPGQKEDFNKIQEEFRKIIGSSPGVRLILLMEIVKSRENAINLLDKYMQFFDYILYQPENDLNLSKKETAALISKFMAARKYIERNLNYRATIDVLFLGLNP